VAADSGRSEIRSSMNLKLEGASFESIFVIADIRIDLPYPTERLAFFDPDWNRGNTILMHREPHGIWRVDYQLPPGETPEEALRPESLKQRIDAQLKMIGFEGTPWEMDWNSVYSARTLTLPQYVHKRIVFTGDAAHLLPIFGVRGANTAFQDAQSLGWHLAFVLKGLAPEKLMQNHSTERVGAAREIITEAARARASWRRPVVAFVCYAMPFCLCHSHKNSCDRCTTGAPRGRMNTVARCSTVLVMTTRSSSVAPHWVHHHKMCNFKQMTIYSTT
jgi:3-(3-hydroxy-phenyl)propionate hydroxylase